MSGLLAFLGGAGAGAADIASKQLASQTDMDLKTKLLDLQVQKEKDLMVAKGGYEDERLDANVLKHQTRLNTILDQIKSDHNTSASADGSGGYNAKDPNGYANMQFSDLPTTEQNKVISSGLLGKTAFSADAKQYSDTNVAESKAELAMSKVENLFTVQNAKMELAKQAINAANERWADRNKTNFDIAMVNATKSNGGNGRDSDQKMLYDIQARIAEGKEKPGDVAYLQQYVDGKNKESTSTSVETKPDPLDPSKTITARTVTTKGPPSRANGPASNTTKPDINSFFNSK